ncbi:MAG: hypothetical protein RLP14_08075 [Owenweeksia sp.]
MKSIYFLISMVLLVSFTKAQNTECKYTPELDDFNFDGHTIGDTSYSIVSDKKLIRYFVISCKGDCYVQEIDRETNIVFAEGYYAVHDNRVDTVETKLFDPEDVSKFEVRIDYLTYPLKTGLWIYQNMNNEVERKVIYRNGKEVLVVMGSVPK